MSVHAHLEVSEGVTSREVAGRNGEVTLLALMDLADARFVARARKSVEHTDPLLKARSSGKRQMP